MKYGETKPPKYNLWALEDWPIALLHGTKDVLADTKDVNFLASQLHPSSLIFHREYQLGHMTFHIGKDTSYLYDVLSILTNY